MDAAAVIRLARLRSDLSKRELARRAGTSPAAIVLYESGAREPTYPTLARIVHAAGFETRLSIRPSHRPDPAELGRRLGQVLDLAEQLPRRRAARHTAFPPFGPRIGR